MQFIFQKITNKNLQLLDNDKIIVSDYLTAECSEGIVLIKKNSNILNFYDKNYNFIAKIQSQIKNIEKKPYFTSENLLVLLNQDSILIYNINGVQLYFQSIKIEGQLVNYQCINNEIYILTEEFLYQIDDINKYIWSTKQLNLNQIYKIQGNVNQKSQFQGIQYENQKIQICWSTTDNQLAVYKDNQVQMHILPSNITQIFYINQHSQTDFIIELFTSNSIVIYNFRDESIELTLNYNPEQSYVFTPLIIDLPLVYNIFYKEIELIKDVDLLSYQQYPGYVLLYTLQGIYQLRVYQNNFSQELTPLIQSYELYTQQSYAESTLKLKKIDNLFDLLKQFLSEIQKRSEIQDVKKYIKAFNFCKLFLSGKHQFELCQLYDPLINKIILLQKYQKADILASWLDIDNLDEKRFEILQINNQKADINKLNKSQQIRALKIQFLASQKQDSQQIIKVINQLFQQLTKIEKNQICRWLININYNQDVIKYIIKQSDDQDSQLDLLLKLQAYEDAIELSSKKYLYGEIISTFLQIEQQNQKKVEEIFQKLSEQTKNQIIQFMFQNFKYISDISPTLVISLSKYSQLLQYKLKQVDSQKLNTQNLQLLQYQHKTEEIVDIVISFINSNRHLNKVIKVEQLQQKTLQELFISIGQILFITTFVMTFNEKQFKLKNLELKQFALIEEAIKLTQTLDKKIDLSQQQTICDIIKGIVIGMKQQIEQYQEFNEKSVIINSYLYLIVNIINNYTRQIKPVIGDIIQNIYQQLPSQLITTSILQSLFQYLSSYQLLELSCLTENKIFLQKGLADVQYRNLVSKCYKSLPYSLQQSLK